MQPATGAYPVTSPPQQLGRTVLEQAFDEHHSMIFRTAYRVTGNAADAEDVLQTVFLRLASRDSDAEGFDNVGAYMRRAAVNASLNLLDLRSRKNIPLDKAPEPLASGDSGELRQVLRLAIGKLERRAAEMFTLRFIEGHSNSEIAEMFGVSTLVVAVSLHRSRRQLQKDIRELGGLL